MVPLLGLFAKFAKELSRNSHPAAMRNHNEFFNYSNGMCNVSEAGLGKL